MTDRWDFKRFFNTPNQGHTENLFPKIVPDNSIPPGEVHLLQAKGDKIVRHKIVGLFQEKEQ